MIYFFYHKDLSKDKPEVSAFIEVAELLRGYANFVAIGCHMLEFQDDDDNYPRCGFNKLNNLPKIQGMSPPEIPFNPYTKVANEFSEKSFSADMTYEEIYKWILSSMPEYIKTLKTRADVSTMLENKDLIKVILFSSKKDTSSLYRALASNFRFKLKFYYIK